MSIYKTLYDPQGEPPDDRPVLTLIAYLLILGTGVALLARCGGFNAQNG